MEQKTSAHYQRLHRQRLREQGLVKKEVWILPEYGAALQQLEKQMRVSGLQPDSMVLIHKEGSMDNSRQAYRDIHALAGDLQQSTLVQGGRLHIEVLEGADASLLISLPEFGDLPARAYDRYALKPGDRFQGPAVVEERESSCSFGPDCVFSIDRHFNLVIELGAAPEVAASRGAVAEEAAAP